MSGLELAERSTAGGPVARRIAAIACALLLSASGCGGDSPPAGPPNIFLFTVESLRPDHLGPYAPDRETTPSLDQLASEALVYEDAHSVTSWTLASHASMFTGLYPSAHGADGPLSALDDSALTLAEILSDSGYQTAGFASGPYLSRRHRLDQGFEYYDDSTATVGVQRGAHDDVTNPAFERVIRNFLETERDASRPLFLFAYFWDPHYDYIPPPPYDRMFVDDSMKKIELDRYEGSGIVGPHIDDAELRYVKSQYEGEIRFTDHHLGRIFEAIEQAGLWDDSVVIVTSDHGEEFFDHGQKGHKRTLYVESVHVPLIVKLPRASAVGRDARLVSLVDLFPTILELAGVEPPEPRGGSSLLAAPDPDRPIFFELTSSSYFPLADGSGHRREDEEWLAVRRGDEKLIVVPTLGRTELYRVGRDPTEQLDVAIEDPKRVEELQDVLQDWRDATRARRVGGDAPRADLDAAELERLRALGYLDRPPPDDGKRPPPTPAE